MDREEAMCALDGGTEQGSAKTGGRSQRGRERVSVDLEQNG